MLSIVWIEEGKNVPEFVPVSPRCAGCHIPTRRVEKASIIKQGPEATASVSLAVITSELLYRVNSFISGRKLRTEV